MYLIRDEMWNSIDVFGPQTDIDRFKRLCLSVRPTDNVIESSRGFDPHHVVWIETATCTEATWNFREPREQDLGHYSFNFDTHTNFPTAVFKDLAVLFPMLAFDCECIADNDSSMGYGWFNPPPGGEDFHDYYEVPEGYWTTGASKRSRGAERRHLARVAELKRKFSEVEE